jgi:nitroreductase
MNLLLKATELGLSTLVMGLRDAKQLHDILSIDDNESIVSVIAVGYPDIEPSMPKRKSVEDIAKFY